MKFGRPFTAPAVLLALGWLVAGCTGETKRVDPDSLSEIETGAGLTSQDYRSVSMRMARSLIQLPQIQNAKSLPRIAFFRPENRSNYFIDGEMFLDKMRTELLRNGGAGRITFLDRKLVRAIEQENAMKAAGQRTGGAQTVFGADFFLTGTIDSIDKVAGGGHTSYIRLSFRLTDAANSAIVWEDDYEIKKHSTRGTMFQ